jgi:HAD superfamily hydrolase (TIGR01549 family)
LIEKSTLRGVIFDLGGTLMYFDGSWPEALLRSDQALFAALREAGVELDRERFLLAFRRELEAYYQEREAEFIEYTTLHVLRTLLASWGCPAVPDPVLQSALRQMYAVTQACWKVEEDTIQSLETLRGRGLQLGLISNAADDADVQALVDKAGIRPYLDPIVTSAAAGIRKPDPRIFTPLLDAWSLAPGQVVMVGDTQGADVLGAQNAGLYSIWIDRRGDTPANRAHRDTLRPDLTISTLAELPAVLQAAFPKRASWDSSR